VWLGLSVVLVDEPSPKFQFQETGLPVEVSENWTARGAWPLVGLAVKLATGADAVPWMTMVALLDAPIW